MRLTSFGIALALLTVLVLHSTAGRTDAQIPERILFQPGSYAYGMYQPAPQPGFARTKTVLVEVPGQAVEVADADDGTSDWERDFSVAEKVETVELVEVQVPEFEPAPVTPPYLAYYRHPITHRVHVVPYQKGYPEGSEDMPKHQSRLNLWLSTLPCREQNRSQVQYLGYYDPAPEILEDRPSRIDLILGYPNAQWTTCCENRWGHRLAQCPGIEQHPYGPPAEGSISDQECDPCAPQGLFGGLFAGVRPIGYLPMGPPQPHVFGARRIAVPHAYSHHTPWRGDHGGPCPYCPMPTAQGEPTLQQPLPCPHTGKGRTMQTPSPLPAQTVHAMPKCRDCGESKGTSCRAAARSGKTSCNSAAKTETRKTETRKTKSAAAPPHGNYPLKSQTTKKIETEEVAAKNKP